MGNQSMGRKSSWFWKEIIYTTMRNISKDILFWVVTWDALWVPREFYTREKLRQNPITDMIWYGSHNQHPWTWSDDSSLTLITTEVIKNGYSREKLIDGFIDWYRNWYWTARGEVFDIGSQTKKSIEWIINGQLFDTNQEFQNWNGSLMRILPSVLITKDITNKKERFEVVKEISSITHTHLQSIIACYYYTEFAHYLLKWDDLEDIYKKLKQEIPQFLEENNIPEKEINHFWRLFLLDIYKLNEQDIESDWYVIHTLEASIWALIRNTSFKTSLLTAVNLGGDTDTTGAVTGGLAGLRYWFDSIPKEWVDIIARKQDIEVLAKKQL